MCIHCEKCYIRQHINCSELYWKVSSSALHWLRSRNENVLAWVCGGSWRHEKSLNHHPSSFQCPAVLCVVLWLWCIWVFVWGGVSETSFLLFLHLFFAGVQCTCVSMNNDGYMPFTCTCMSTHYTCRTRPNSKDVLVGAFPLLLPLLCTCSCVIH